MSAARMLSVKLYIVSYAHYFNYFSNFYKVVKYT